MRNRPSTVADLVVSEMNGEGLVYDFRTHQAHCLNATAYAVFRRLDGRTTVEELVRAVRRELGTELTEKMVHLALQRFDQAGLLTEPFVAPRVVDHRRRRVMQQVALTAGATLAIPALWSIVAPSTAEAASVTMCIPFTSCVGTPNGTCCGTPGGPAKTCNNNTCGNNSSNSVCRNKTCG